MVRKFIKLAIDNQLITPPDYFDLGTQRPFYCLIVRPGIEHRATKDNIPVEDVFACLDLNALFRLSWGAKSTGGEAWDRLLAEDFMPRLERLKHELIADRSLNPNLMHPSRLRLDLEQGPVHALTQSSKAEHRMSGPRSAGGHALTSRLFG